MYYLETSLLLATMAAVKTQEHVTLKLMVIKERNKVLFAEARKEFVDVLFRNHCKTCRVKYAANSSWITELSI